MSGAKQASDIWSFSLRSTKTNHDSDSDSDSNNDDPTNSVSEETRLLQEMDISHREETVIYKPNPFSIAKINAAARRPVAPGPDRRPAKPASKKKPTGRIVDSFKKAEKKSLNPKAQEKSKTANAISPPSSKASIVLFPQTTPALDTISQMNDPGIPSIPPQPSHVVIPKISSPSDADSEEVLLETADETHARISAALPHSSRVRAHKISSPSDMDPRYVLPQPVREIPMPTAFRHPSPKKFVSKKFQSLLPNSFSSPLKPPSLELRGTAILSFSSPPRPTQFAFSSKPSLARDTAYRPHSTTRPSMYNFMTISPETYSSIRRRTYACPHNRTESALCS